MDERNASRFLKCYNHIEAVLKAKYNVKASQSFTDLIKRCSDLDIVVRRFEEELIDYGKLRNAIVHKSQGDKVIAYPCDEVVDTIETIEAHLCAPPLVLDAIKNRKIYTVYADSTIKTAVLSFAEHGIRSMPVYDYGEMVGVLNVRKLIAVLSRGMEEGWDMNEYLITTQIKKIIRPEDAEEYRFLPRDATVFDVFSAFEKKKNLLAVFITEHGKMGEKVLLIVTSTDFPLLNKYMETYKG